jgi:hypothetical protein
LIPQVTKQFGNKTDDWPSMSNQRSTSKGIRKRPRAPKDELAYIERLLGDEFGSLKEARSALKRESEVAPIDEQPVFKRLRKKRALTATDLGIKPETFQSLWANIEENTAAIDALKKPHEMFALQVGGKKTYIIERSARGIADKIRQSAGLRKLQDRSRTKLKDELNVIHGIKLAKLEPGETSAKYIAQKQKQRKENRAKFHREVAKVEVAKERKKAAKEIAREKVKSAKAVARANAKALKDITRFNVAELEKELKRRTKATKGKRAK